jgi:hypothetical protein
MTTNSTPTTDGKTPSECNKASRARAQSVRDYKIGVDDIRGREVLDILWSTDEFVIFQHEKGISPHFSDNADECREQKRRYMRLGPELLRINALLPPVPPSGKTSGEKARVARSEASFFHTSDAFFHRELARAIASALLGDHGSAVEILASTEARLIARRRAQGQFHYLLACTGMLAIIMLIEMAVEFCLPPALSLWRELARVAACGAMGGFLSVAIGIRKLDVDPETRLWVNAYYGLNRLAIAIVSAVVLYFLIKGKLLLEPLFPGTSVQEAFAIYALAVAAGFSETFIPNIFRSTEGRLSSGPEEDRAQSHPKNDDLQTSKKGDPAQRGTSDAPNAVPSESSRLRPP